jgi:NADPH2:quinone reductase
LNFLDTQHRSGQYPIAYPATLGVEATGTIDALGTDVQGFARDERVAYAVPTRPGAYADYAVIPAALLVKVPDDIDDVTAAGVLLQGLTAQFLTTSTFAIAPGRVALVHAAAGGVGHLLVQVIKYRGGHVIALVGDQGKADYVRDLGADHVLVHSAADASGLLAQIRAWTGGRGVDVVYDSVGRKTLRLSIDATAARGYIAIYGEASGRPDPVGMNELSVRSLFLTRPRLTHYTADPDELRRRGDDLFAAIRSGRVRLDIDGTYALEAVRDAHARIESRASRGKIVLRVAQD